MIADNVRDVARALKLPAFESYTDYIGADKPFDVNLLTLLQVEYERREAISLRRRIANAGFPKGTDINTFKYVRTIPDLKKETVDILATCKFIEDGANVCAIGPSGVGKTHLMAAIGREAVNRGYTAKFYRVSDMLTILDEARTEKKLGAMMKTLLKYNILLLDELGYLNLTKNKSQILFDVIAKRYETRSSIYVNSNYEFSKWPQFLGNEIMTKALVGKLTGSSFILNMNGEDYRLYVKGK